MWTEVELSDNNGLKVLVNLDTIHKIQAWGKGKLRLTPNSPDHDYIFINGFMIDYAGLVK